MRLNASDVPDSPSEFFEKILPNELMRMAGATAASARADGVGALCHVLPGGETWSNWLEGGNVVGARGRHPDTVVEVTCIEGEWREIVVLGKLEHAVAILYDPSVAEALRRIEGTLLRRITDREIVYANTLGGVQPDLENPRLTLGVSLEDHHLINEGQGILVIGSQRVELAGDLTMLAELATVLD